MSDKRFLDAFKTEPRSAPASGPRGSDVLHLAVNMVDPDPHQPRKTFDDDKLRELAESLKMHGQLQPVVVRRSGVVGRWQIVAGERRWRACKLAGIDRIRAVELEERGSVTLAQEAQFVENLHREDMSPLETAAGYRGLIELWGVSMSELARRIGVAKSTVSRTLALLETPGESPAPKRKPRRATTSKPDKRRAVELELASGVVRVKRGYTLEQLVEELRATIDAGRTRSDAA